MSALFEVSEKYELLALHRALFEAKHHPNPDSPEVAASPYVASLALRVVDALADLDDPPAFGPGWREWQKFERHEHRLPVIRDRIEECGPWSGWSEGEKREYVQLLLAPLVADESALTALVGYGDDYHRAV